MSAETSQTAQNGAGVADPTQDRRALRWLLIAALLHGCAYLLLLPPWMGEDEPWHVEYAHYIGRGYFPWGGQEISVEGLELSSASQLQVLREIGCLPREEVSATQAEILESMGRFHFWERVDWASNGDGALNFDQVRPYLTATHQPPLYYLLAGQILRLGPGDVLLEMWLLRGLSLLAYLAVVLGSYEVARRVFDDPWMALGCAALVAWWPMHARQAAVVNNDVLVKLFSVWSLVFALEIARRGLTRGRLIGGATLCALAVLSKPTGIASLVPLGLACMLQIGRGESFSPRQKRLGGLGLVLLLAAMPASYYLADSPALPHSLANFWMRLENAHRMEFFGEFARTSVGAFNWYSRDLPQVAYDLVGLALAFAGLGTLVVLLRKRRGIQRSGLYLCLSGALAQLALIAFRGVAAGRYALPMIAAFAVLIVAGWLGPWSQPWRSRAIGWMGLALLLFDGYFLWSGLVWNEYGVWGS